MLYEDVLEYLFQALPMFHRVGPAAYKPDLSNTVALCNILGNPQRDLKYVHVAGTNGKGSTSHLMASALQEAGYKTGLCTSPHLIDFRERIKVDGHMIPKEEVVQFVTTYKDQWESIAPSFFEMSIAMAFWYFKKVKCDIVVLETGLGGRLDSTNIITPEVAVITNVSWDHMNLLGDTLEKIASEKAGIIKKDIPLVLGEMLPNVRSVITEYTLGMNVNIFHAEVVEDAPETELAGYYQEQNRRTAYVALKVLSNKGFNIKRNHIEQGFQHVVRNTSLQGRWQQLSEHPLIVADVAHNTDGIQQLIKQVKDQKFDRLHIVLGMVNDKDISTVLSLLPREAAYYFCKANIPRGLPAEELETKAREVGLSGKTFTSVREAFERAKEEASEKDMILIGGSVFTVAEVL